MYGEPKGKKSTLLTLIFGRLNPELLADTAPIAEHFVIPPRVTMMQTRGQIELRIPNATVAQQVWPFVKKWAGREQRQKVLQLLTDAGLTPPRPVVTLQSKIEDLEELDPTLIRRLKRTGLIWVVGDLTCLSSGELLDLDGIGVKGVDRIKCALALHSLGLADAP